MDLYAVLDQVVDLVRQRKRITYRLLQRQFALDEATLEDLKAELFFAHPQIADADGHGLIWTGDADVTPAPAPAPAPAAPPVPQRPQQGPSPKPQPTAEAERRQLTVLFCDLVDSTRLASQLDPEDLREVVRAYQDTCAKVIARFEGHIAQYLGDGLLVYFGYPQAHDDDAQGAVCTGLGLVEALKTLNTRLEREQGIRLAVRVGIHTGLVVVGAMGGQGRQEQLALGETPNIAARLQGLAAPDTVVISATTAQLIHGYFVCQPLGAQTLKGLTQPLQVYRVLQASGAQTRLDVAMVRGLTPLVGRDEEVALLHRRWEQATAGVGQVVCLSGEAGIGKSRLVQVLKDYVAAEPHTRMEWRGSAYHQQSALYPVIDHLYRLVRWHPDDPPAETLHRLEGMLAAASVAQSDAVPLLAALLSLPVPVSYPPLALTPPQQRQRTLDLLLAWLHAETQRQPVLLVVEDLHWVDPSTLELLSMLIDQGAQARLCLLLTARPEFHPSWAMGAHLTTLTLRRLAPAQVAHMATYVAGDKPLPAAILQELVSKTDGVPLFVEELTKTVLASGLLQEQEDGYALPGPLPPLAIPTTLHDALMARLDRLATVKALAQLGATLGREFSYELLQAVSPWDEGTLQRGLHQLVEAEFLYQQGLPPQATFVFKHALIQEEAYQSLLRHTRRQYHQQIAQVLEAQFPETVAEQPELLAQHYTAAGLAGQAVMYWQRAGQQALQRSANLEAIQHLTMGLQLLATLPETPTRAQQELELQLALGPAFMAIEGFAASEVEQTYARAWVLCQQVGGTLQLFPTLWGLYRSYLTRGALPKARELGEQLVSLAQREAAPTLRLEAYEALGTALFHMGEYTAAWEYLRQGITLIDPAMQQAQTLHHGEAPGMRCLAVATLTLWCLGYPAQAVQRCQEALALAQALTHPHSLAAARYWAILLHYRRREVSAAKAQADALLTLATEHEFSLMVGHGTFWQGWARAMQGQSEVGLTQMHQGLTAILTTGQTVTRPLYLVLLAESAGHAGQVEEGLRLLAEALIAIEESGRGEVLAEAYRCQGELLLRHATPDTAQAAICFQQALALARRQEAKSWELRAAMSLARLWQQQGKHVEAHALLAPVYGWFTEGFDTADLQDAKALLEA